ncbi:MAG TPA: PAS domain S-box protein [Thermoanaerobaculia bacterium]|nr:PAS domain S-box protein [Thermoanaerobaculia bacterium]
MNQFSIEQAQAFLAAIVESSDDAIIGKSLDGIVLTWNRAAERLFGYSAEEMIGQPVAILAPPDRRDEMPSILAAVRRGERVDHFETERMTKDGRRLQVSLSVSPIEDTGGRVVGAAKIARDITRRKWAERALAESNEELRAANSRAEAANAAKDRFLATLSHELRTPLTPILAITSALEEDDRLPADMQEALSRVRRNVELEARLIDDLLDLTRVARGKLELHREVVDLAEILDHALLTCCTAEVTSGRLAVTTDLAAADHRLWADSPRLTQVFWNLLNNAVKFTPTGGSIAVRSSAEPDPQGRRLAVAVTDSGIGIDPEVLPRIFDGFEQGERTITRRFGGLGLGLAVSKAIVEMHGGELTAASAGRDRGATFTVRLPVGALPVSTAERAAAGLAAAPSPPREERSLHILLVEDHADTAAAMAELLAAVGHRVSVAGSVGEGLAAAAAASNGPGIDLVVSDLGLPDGNGLDLMRELSAQYGLKGIALSGYGMEEDIQRSRAAGFGLHLTKPVKLQTLVAAIQQAIG